MNWIGWALNTMRPLWYPLNIQSSHSPDNSEDEVFVPGLKAVTWHSHSTQTVLVRRCRNMPWSPQTLHSCSPACGLCHSSAPVIGCKTSFLLKFFTCFKNFFISLYWRLWPRWKGYHICIFPLPSGAPELLEGSTDLFTVLGIWQLWQQVFVEWMPLLLSKSCKWGITGAGHSFILITGAGHPFILLIMH